MQKYVILNRKGEVMDTKRTPSNSLMTALKYLEREVQNLRTSLEAHQHPNSAQFYISNIEGYCSHVKDHLTRALKHWPEDK